MLSVKGLTCHDPVSFFKAIRDTYRRFMYLQALNNFLRRVIWEMPSTVAALSKAWNASARSNTGIVGSNPTQGMDACLCLC
jgi:hypothetical protein